MLSTTEEQYHPRWTEKRQTGARWSNRDETGKGFRGETRAQLTSCSQRWRINRSLGLWAALGGKNGARSTGELMMWVFGYGSLMWDGWETQRGCSRRVLADLSGYCRVF